MNDNEIKNYLIGVKDILGDRPPTKEEWKRICETINSMSKRDTRFDIVWNTSRAPRVYGDKITT